MSNAHLIVNKLLEADADAPEPYLDWLGQKVETGPLDKIRFGAYIHLSDEQTIRENAAEQGIDVDSQAFWDEIERCMAIMESHCLQLLREAGLHVSDEGHDETGARVASVWIDTPEEDRKLALLKAVINWAEGDWPSTTSGTMDYAFGADTTQRIYAATEDAARFIDVTIEFSGTDALVEWSRLNLNEAIKGDPDDPDVFLQSYVPRMMGRLLMEFNIIKPHFPDAPTNWYRERVDGMDLFRYNRASEMKEIMRQMKAYNRQRGERAGIDQVTYRYKVPNPQGSSIVRRWLDKIGCPPTIIQWACETNPPIWFWVSVKEFNAYMQMVYPQVKLDPVVEGIDDPSPDLVNQIKPKVVCPRCGAEAELGYGEDKLDTHPTALIHHDSEVPIERYLHPSDQGIHHFDIKQIYKCHCGERFEGTQPSYTVENIADPDDPEAFVKSYRKTYYKLFYGRKFGEGAFVGVYHSLDDAVAAAKERKLRARARSVWVVEEVHPDATDDNVIAGSEPTGLVYDILKGYVVAEPRRVVIESLDLDDPEAFLKRFKPRWKRLAHVKNHHFYFTDEAGRVAVADYSMQNQSDPESADDGLLILDKSKPITTYRWQGERRYSLPTTQYYGGLGSVPRQSSITANKIEFDDVWPKLEALGFQLQVREEDEEADPRAYLDAVTGWIDTFVKAGMTRYDTETHKDQLWKKYEVPGYNYWIYVHVREPKWIIVERTDALYGKNIFRRVFEFPDKDINGMVNAFSVLDRKFTKARTRATDDWPAVDSEIDQLYQQHKRRRDRWLSGKIKEAVDDPEVQDYLDRASPEACQHCNNDLTKRHTVVRQYVDRHGGTIHELSGHYDAAEGYYTNDEPFDKIINYLPHCDLPADCDICARCGKSTAKQNSVRNESVDEPEQYLQGPVYSLDDLRSKLENYGLSFPSNGIKPWGRWAVIDGFTYWAVYSKDPDKWLPQSYFREQLEKFCKDMGFTVYHIQLFGEYPEGVTFKLAVPKMQIDPEAYGAQERRLSDPDFDNERQAHEIIQRDWLPEALGVPDPDAPEHYVQTAHTDMKRVIPSLGFEKPTAGNFGDNHYFYYGHATNNDFTNRYTLTITDHPEEGYCIVCGWRQNEGSHCTAVSYDELIPYITRLKQLLDTTYRADMQSAIKRAKVQESKETVDYPAVYVGGKIFIGPSHYHIVSQLESNGIDVSDAHHGWWTSHNRFLDTDLDVNELMRLSKKFAQRTGEEPGLKGEELPKAKQMTGVREVHEAADPDDPQQFIQHMETDWRKILRKHGFKPQPHSDHLSYALTYPDRVWGANWPVNIYAHHGWNPHPEFEYDHPDPDNPDIDAEDAAYDEWQRHNDEFAAIRQRDIAFPDYIAFQFGREYYRRLEVPASQLDSFLTRLVAGAKKVVGTETVASVHQGRGLTEMLWEVGKEAARELKIPVKESMDDVDPLAYAASTFNVDELLKRMGYQRSTREEIPFEWHKVFHRMPTELDLMVEVKRRGLGGEENEGDVVYDITLYRYPVNDNPNRIWEPIVYRYGRSNLQLERVLKRLEERIKANNLRGIRDEVDESVPIPPEDEPENLLPAMEKSLVKAELQRLDFGPKPERGIEWIYREEMPRFWWNKYEGADGKPHGLYINFVSGQTPEVQTRNYNPDAKAWFVKGQEGPLQCPAESPAHLAAIVRDLDSTMKRCAAESTPPDQEYEALKRVIEHHRKWWDDTLDYLIAQDNRLPGRIGPGQPA